VHAVGSGIFVQVTPLSDVTVPASITVTPPSGSGMIDEEPHTFGSPAPPQVSPGGQVAPPSFGPHGTRPPQPSAMLPQFIGMPPLVTQTVLAFAGTHAATPPHSLAVPPPPQLWGATHVTHGAGMSPPQPSACCPHSPDTLGSAHVFGVQGGAPHALAVPPPPHDWPLGQSPH
jgi:hypothetical protein